MGNSKIVKHVGDGYNFDYRVCRHYEKNDKGQRRLVDGVPDSYLYIHEIHFGEDGEIVAYIKEPERIFGDDLEDMIAELKEYEEATTKPILDFDFVVDQTKRSSRRMKRLVKQNKIPDSEIGKAYASMEAIKEGTEKCIPIDDVWEALGIRKPVITYEGDEDASE